MRSLRLVARSVWTMKRLLTSCALIAMSGKA
jgi:hypothetical protein